MKNVFRALLVVSLLSISVVHAQSPQDNWPSWRGPSDNGVASTGNPPLTWSETENVQWKIALPGHGSSTPVIWGDKLFLLAAIETEKIPEGVEEDKEEEPSGPNRGAAPKHLYNFDVLCYNRNTGDLLWQKTAKEAFPHERHHPDHGYASYSPVTDGNFVWVNFGSRGVHCFDMDGNKKWSMDLGEMQTHRSFGEASSPVLAGKALVVQMDDNVASKIVALDKMTGKILWQKARDEMTSWTSPLCVEVEGKLQIITSATTNVRCYDAATGDVIWTTTGHTRNVIPAPVAGFGNVYCISGFRGALVQAIQLGHRGDLTGTEAILWESTEVAPYVPSPILYGERLYFGSGVKAKISCYNALTGKPYYSDQDLDGLKGMYASPMGVANRIYLVSRDGVTKVIENADSYKELATNTLNDEIDASPAIVGNAIYLRGKTHLYCIAE